MKRTSPDVSKVDIAPLIDVTFLLIIFFMSIWQAAHMEVQAELSLPMTTQGDPEVKRDTDRLIVNVDKSGAYFVANQRLGSDQLKALLLREAARSRDEKGFANRPVFVRADAELPFGDIQEVMLMCRDARIWKLSLRTQQPVEDRP